MGKWKYDLKEDGKKLRELIGQGASRENCKTIIDQIILCCNTAKAQMTLSDREEYEYDLWTLVEDCEDTKCYLEEDDEDYNENEIDDILDRFYDLMDSMRVWITL